MTYKTALAISVLAFTSTSPLLADEAGNDMHSCADLEKKVPEQQAMVDKFYVTHNQSGPKIKAIPKEVKNYIKKTAGRERYGKNSGWMRTCEDMIGLGDKDALKLIGRLGAAIPEGQRGFLEVDIRTSLDLQRKILDYRKAILDQFEGKDGKQSAADSVKKIYDENLRVIEAYAAPRAFPSWGRCASACRTVTASPATANPYPGTVDNCIQDVCIKGRQKARAALTEEAKNVRDYLMHFHKTMLYSDLSVSGPLQKHISRTQERLDRLEKLGAVNATNADFDQILMFKGELHRSISLSAEYDERRKKNMQQK